MMRRAIVSSILGASLRAFSGGGAGAVDADDQAAISVISLPIDADPDWIAG
jgi:hypothetical protein